MKFIQFTLAVVGAALVASAATAAPDQSGSGVISEPNGFPGVCDQPCFTVEKTYEVYFAGNATAPAACAPGENTYVYTLKHTGGSGSGGGFVPALTGFELKVETDDVGSATWLSGYGIDPTGVLVDTAMDVVTYQFGNAIADGGLSTKLVVCSVLLPGGLVDNLISVDGQASLDAPGACVGPLVPPAGGDPMPCTIGYWKNRYAEKQGTLQHFSDADFSSIVTQGVALSNGLFVDEADLLAALSSKGSRTPEERARQQFSAFLLNLAAGDVVPDNSKCRLFETNSIDTNACGVGISVQDAVDNFFASYNAGDFLAAKDCADDTNNGIGVVGATEGD